MHFGNYHVDKLQLTMLQEIAYSAIQLALSITNDWSGPIIEKLQEGVSPCKCKSCDVPKSGTSPTCKTVKLQVDAGMNH